MKSPNVKAMALRNMRTIHFIHTKCIVGVIIISFFFISFKHIIRTHGRYEILYVLAVSGSIVPLNKCICADYITWKEKTDPNRSLCNMISLCIDSYVCESVIDSDFFSFIIFSLLLLLFCFAQQYIVFVII